MRNTDNPSYVTVMPTTSGRFYAAVMEWSKVAGGYQVTDNMTPWRQRDLAETDAFKLGIVRRLEVRL